MPDKFRFSFDMVPITDLPGNISALSAMLGEEGRQAISYEDWADILTSEGAIGNADIMTPLHDQLMGHGSDIRTAEQLRALVQSLKTR